MKKHITVEAVNQPQFDKVVVKVVAQTHRGNDFASYTNRDPRKFQSSNGVILASNRRPARDEVKTGVAKNTYWLRGSATAKDNQSFVCTKAEFDQLCFAVREYNAFEFPVKPAPRPAYTPTARTTGCTVIVG